MPKLVIQHKGKTVQELDLTGEIVTLGRGEENTINLDDNLVSRAHAEIREERGRYYLSDLGSANGTYVGTKRITRDYELRDGDIIKISPYTIFFRLTSSEKPTQVGRVETGERATEIFTFSGAPRVLVRSGAEVGQIYDLSNNPLIGRDPECDIVLSEPSVSRRHARIQFIDNKLSIMDVGSKSGTRVNGKLIDKPTSLKDGDRIQLGEVLLEVEWKGAPKVEVERPTVPYFRPEPAAVTAEKKEWWKWVVGIAAAVIIVIGVVYLYLYLFVTPHRAYRRLISEAKNLFAEGSINSDTARLNIALAKVDSALQRQPKEEAKILKNDIGKKIEELTSKVLVVVSEPLKPAPRLKTRELYDASFRLYRDGHLKEAKEILNQILTSYPNDSKAKELKERIELWEKGNNYLVIGDTSQTQEIYRELLIKDPGNKKLSDLLATFTSPKPPVSKWNSERAKQLFQEAEKSWAIWKDYGSQEANASAIPKYQEIVEFGPPPGNAGPEDWNIYNIAKERLGQK